MIDLCGGQVKTEAYEALCPSMPRVLIPGLRLAAPRRVWRLG